MQNLGRTLLIIGLALAAVGAALTVAGKFGLPFGKLPGDITYQRKNITIFAPLGSMLVLSVIVSIILNIFSRWK